MGPDRLCDLRPHQKTAARAAMNQDDLLEFVMAHEISLRLLLPRGAHVESGLMRGHWNVRDFQQIDVLKLRFSPEQSQRDPQHALRNSPTVAVTAAESGSDVGGR